MKIIVLQLARLGDVLQTLPTLQGLKKKHPTCHLTLVVRSTFADAAKLSPHVDKVVELPTAEVLGPIILGGGEARAESRDALARWIAENFLAGEACVACDQLINLTFSRASSYLAGIIPAKRRLGIRGTHSGAHAIDDLWSQYFFAQVLGRNRNILHLNELFARISGADEGIWPVELAEPQASFVPSDSDIDLIGVQLTASQPHKTLNLETWIKVCKAIAAARAGTRLAFFGSSADKDTVAEVIKALPEDRTIDLAGRMPFHDNVHWVRRCRWIVSPDTALVHLASLVATPVIEIAVGPVRPEETGPYGEGHHVVYPVSCDAAALGEQIAHIMAGGETDPCVAHSVTRFAKRAAGGVRNELVPSNFVPEESSNFFTQAYYLLAEFRCAGRLEDIMPPRLGEAGVEDAVNQMINAYDALCAIKRIADLGQLTCMKLLNKDPAKTLIASVQEEAANLAQLESMLATFEKTVPLVKPLIDTWSVAKDLAHSPDELGGIEEALAISEGAYRELGQNVEIIQQLLQTAVDAASTRRRTSTSPSLQELGPKERVE